MKKILIMTLSAAILSSTALADSENMFYFKGHVGGQSLSKVTDKNSGLKLKSKFNPFVSLAVGYSAMDNVRTDLSFSHYFDPSLKRSGVSNANVKGNVKHKADINALMINAYVDLFDASVANFFIGAGVGVAQIKEKITWSFDPAYVPAAASSKKNNNFAYDVTAGASSELSAGVNGEITYSWRDFGKTKSAKVTRANSGVVDEVSKSHYKGHHISLGIRFDI